MPSQVEMKAYERGITKRFAFETEGWSRLNIHSVELTVNRRAAHREFCEILSKARLGMPKHSREMQEVRRRLRALTATTLPSIQFGIFPVRRCPPGIPRVPTVRAHRHARPPCVRPRRPRVRKSGSLRGHTAPCTTPSTRGNSPRPRSRSRRSTSVAMPPLCPSKKKFSSRSLDGLKNEDETVE